MLIPNLVQLLWDGWTNRKMCDKANIRKGNCRIWVSWDSQFSHSVMSDSLQPHGLQHVRPTRPSLTRRVCSNSCPLSQQCHPTISSCVIPFFSCPQSFPTSRSFPMSWLFTSGGQRLRIGASTSVLPINIQAMDMSLSKLRDWWCTGRSGMLQSVGLQRVRHNWAAELNWTDFL